MTIRISQDCTLSLSTLVFIRLNGFSDTRRNHFVVDLLVLVRVVDAVIAFAARRIVIKLSVSPLLLLSEKRKELIRGTCRSQRAFLQLSLNHFLASAIQIRLPSFFSRSGFLCPIKCVWYCFHIISCLFREYQRHFLATTTILDIDPCR